MGYEVKESTRTCPYCQATHTTVTTQKRFTTPALIVLLAGLLLSPVCIGLIMIPIAFGMREMQWYCSNCYKWI